MPIYTIDIAGKKRLATDGVLSAVEFVRKHPEAMTVDVTAKSHIVARQRAAKLAKRIAKLGRIADACEGEEYDEKSRTARPLTSVLVYRDGAQTNQITPADLP
jgi:hypothetical protein